MAEERLRGQEQFKKDMISVRVDGDDKESDLTLEKDVIAAVAGQGVLRETVVDPERYQTGWRFKPSDEKLAQYQIQRTELGQQLRDIFGPSELSQLRVNGESVYIYTQTGRTSRDLSVDELQKLEVRSVYGTSVPLNFLGSWAQTHSLKNIEREEGVRVLNVDFKFDPTSNVEIAKRDADLSLKVLKEKYPSYTFRALDANERDAENKVWSLKLALSCVAFVLGVLFLTLRSVTLPFITIVPIGMGISGAIWALYLHGMPLTFMAMVGMLGVIGVSVNDSLVMVYAMNELKNRDGRLCIDAIVNGARSRLRAIFLVSLTSWIGVFPTAYGFGGESGFTQPIAFTMGWGLFVAANMALFILPAAAMIREDILGWIQRQVRWTWLTSKRRLGWHRWYRAAPSA